jgi:predicted alpha/beta hydrolase family esterase
MKQIIIIHWWDRFADNEQFYEALKKWEYNPFQKQKKWRDWLEEQLKEEYQVFLPEMPCKHNADYVAWKIWFEKHFEFLNNEDLILIWYSLGWNFLAKYLAENIFPKQIKQLHLVAPSFDQEGFIVWDIWNFSFDPNILKNLSIQVEEIFLYQSEDDPLVPFSQSQKYLQYLPQIKFFKFQDKGHFFVSEFPELLDAIKGD